MAGSGYPADRIVSPVLHATVPAVALRHGRSPPTAARSIRFAFTALGRPLIFQQVLCRSRHRHDLHRRKMVSLANAHPKPDDAGARAKQAIGRQVPAHALRLVSTTGGSERMAMAKRPPTARGSRHVRCRMAQRNRPAAARADPASHAFSASKVRGRRGTARPPARRAEDGFRGQMGRAVSQVRASGRDPQGKGRHNTKGPASPQTTDPRTARGPHAWPCGRGRRDIGLGNCPADRRAPADRVAIQALPPCRRGFLGQGTLGQPAHRALQRIHSPRASCAIDRVGREGGRDIFAQASCRPGRFKLGNRLDGALVDRGRRASRLSGVMLRCLARRVASGGCGAHRWPVHHEDEQNDSLHKRPPLPPLHAGNCRQPKLHRRHPPREAAISTCS